MKKQNELKKKQEENALNSQNYENIKNDVNHQPPQQIENINNNNENVVFNNNLPIKKPIKESAKIIDSALTVQAQYEKHFKQ